MEKSEAQIRMLHGEIEVLKAALSRLLIAAGPTTRNFAYQEMTVAAEGLATDTPERSTADTLIRHLREREKLANDYSATTKITE